VGQHSVGDEFSKWPLHVTIIPWFRLDDLSEQIARGLTEAMSSISPFLATVGEEVLFGPRKDRPANLLQLPSPFMHIEPKVRSYLHKKRAWLVDETTKRRYEFRPHVTVQGSHRLKPGDGFSCGRLYIVEQMGDYKKVTAEVIL
jgi:hypothetical protein